MRLYAEDPAADYQPQSGTLTRFEIPLEDGIRVDAGYETGSEVSTHYDAMLAKVIAHAPTRERRPASSPASWRGARIHGVRTNRDQLVAVLRDERFLAGEVSTDLLPLVDPLVQTGRDRHRGAGGGARPGRGGPRATDRPAGHPDRVPQRRLAAAGDRVRGRHDGSSGGAAARVTFSSDAAVVSASSTAW